MLARDLLCPDLSELLLLDEAAVRKKKRGTGGDRYAPALRLIQVKELINATGGVTVYELADRLSVSVRTAIRYIRALQANGEPLDPDREGRATIWRLLPSARHRSVSLSATQSMALVLSRRVFDFLEGTGFKEDLDEMFDRLVAMLKRNEWGAVRDLERKIYDVNEAPHIYADRYDHVNDIMTALIREERLLVTHGSVAKYQKSFLFDPYTLVIYKKGLYLAGYSHHHKSVRTFSLDGFKEVDWQKGAKFKYPADHQPSRLFEGAFGLHVGPRTQVRIFFAGDVARYVRRRQWHPTQQIKKVEGGIELSMEVAGTVELVSWVLGWGDKAEVLEPESLREEIGAELGRAAARYSRK